MSDVQEMYRIFCMPSKCMYCVTFNLLWPENLWKFLNHSTNKILSEVDFAVTPLPVWFWQMLMFDFSHHNIEMACSLLDTCGRFLYRSQDSHHRTKIYLVSKLLLNLLSMLLWGIVQNGPSKLSLSSTKGFVFSDDLHSFKYIIM